MPVKIGNASIDENNNAKNGKSGDQTSKEVCIRTWYNKPWTYVLRCKDSQKAELMAQACEKGCNNEHLGYDQNQRNALDTQAKKVGYDLSKITVDCECDCSSYMTVCAWCADIKVPYNKTNAPTTSTMKTAFTSTGMFDVLTDKEYLSTDANLKRGDILVKTGSHTVMVLENGSNISNDVVPKPINPSRQLPIKVVDVSHHNTVTDWSKLSSEISDVIIRMGYIGSTTGVLTTDKKFKEHIEQASKHNMNIGIYMYSQCINESEAIKLADYCIDAIKNYKITYPIYIDDEPYNTSTKKGAGRSDNLSREQRTKNIIAFCERVKQRGYIPGVYTSESFYNSRLIYSQLTNYEIWTAKYSKNQPKTPRYEAWQYGSENFSWATAPIDVNWFYKDYTKDNSVTPTPTPTPSVNEKEYYQVRKITATSLRIRSFPDSSDNKNVVGSYKQNEVVQVIALCNNGWYKTDKGYISGNQTYSKPASGQIYACDALNFRESPVKGNIIKSYKSGTKLSIVMIDKTTGWYYCLLPGLDNVYGWCSNKLMRII